MPADDSKLTHRKPRAAETLRRITRTVPNAFNEVIDVGVQGMTDYLVDAASNSFHHLFEPAPEYHKVLQNNYDSRGIKYKLYPVALSDESGTMLLHKLSNDQSGRITHTQLLTERDEKRQNLIGIEPLSVLTLDEAFSPGQLRPFEYIVKIDVDGIEEKIIKGGKRVISEAAAVSIEAPVSTILSRSNLLTALGHKLFDIVELCYYDHALWQVDLIFVHSNLLEEYPDLSPLKTAQKSGGIDFSLWYPLNRDY